ncbi:uncharacterized protein [Parasteatoda tepidariorum]|uniref:uncharacterized protein n=1 Tax=Parasteatoda tepidariorum TaxID=114398 RepID=UPI00077F8C37|nr:uncharacterized protein LOC107446438 [Parasteatoda tepidariorum]
MIPKHYCNLVYRAENIENSIKKCWEIEEIDNTRILSDEEAFCESHFQNNHKRTENGRYMVKMPIREEALETIGESRYLARKRLNQTVRRLNTNPEMKKLYCEFINEYENLNHMEKVVEDVSPSLSYYMPHHGIFRPKKTSTKLRVVFNASTPTSAGQSLNDILLTGEARENVFDLIVRFQKHKIALTADIRKMFRQILIYPSQRDLLRILWKIKKTRCLQYSE